MTPRMAASPRKRSILRGGARTGSRSALILIPGEAGAAERRTASCVLEPLAVPTNSLRGVDAGTGTVRVEVVQQAALLAVLIRARTAGVTLRRAADLQLTARRVRRLHAPPSAAVIALNAPTSVSTVHLLTQFLQSLFSTLKLMTCRLAHRASRAATRETFVKSAGCRRDFARRAELCEGVSKVSSRVAAAGVCCQLTIGSFRPP